MRVLYLFICECVHVCTCANRCYVHNYMCASFHLLICYIPQELCGTQFWPVPMSAMGYSQCHNDRTELLQIPIVRGFESCSMALFYH